MMLREYLLSTLPEKSMLDDNDVEEFDFDQEVLRGEPT
jgi:hypothetical protein